MQFYLIISHFDSYFVFILSPCLSIGPRSCRHSGTRRKEGSTTYNNNNTQGRRGGRRWFFLSPSLPKRKATSPLTNSCYFCRLHHVGGGGGGHGRCWPLHLYLTHRPNPRSCPRPRPCTSANSDLAPALRDLQLRTRPRTYPCFRPWPRPPPNIGLSMIYRLLLCLRLHQ